MVTIPYFGLNKYASRKMRPSTRTIQGPEGKFSQNEISRPVHEPKQPRIPPAQNILVNESERR